ncbi:hypothetical protein BDR04DRAFT_1088796 [Suillus decipiens]|nr:hypothetical protein BDR04DRAFT_1088796 [Suillus decipiens]
MDTFDVIIGHSFGCSVTLSLLPFLPKTKETTIILVDSDLEFPEAQINIFKDYFVDWTTNIRTAEEHMAENPTWLRRDCVLRTMGIAMVDPTIIEVYRQNRSWSFSGLLKSIPPHVKIIALVSQADPE